jgi:multimeric flavodoxin WrbA
VKIIIINGSPRSNGMTGQILLKIRDALLNMDPGVEIDYIDLSKMNLLYCIGCATCYREGSCIIKKDGLIELSQKIAQCNGVVFGSPTYATNVSGQFKVFIDRMQFPFTQLLSKKACFSVVTYENYGGSKAQTIIKEQIRNSGGTLCCKILYKLNNGDNALDFRTDKRINKLCKTFLYKMKKENPLLIPERILSALVFNVGIKPHAFRNKTKFRGVINRWIDQGLIEGDKIS